MTSEALLTKAETYYKVKVQSKSWGALSKEEEELIAMKAVFKDINLKLGAKRKTNKKTGKRSTSSNDYDRPKGNQGKKIPKWKLENKDDDTKLKKEGKTYHWCKWHNNNKGQWVLHHPSKRKNCPENRRNGDNNQSQDQAMAEIQEDDESVAAISVSSEESEE